MSQEARFSRNFLALGLTVRGDTWAEFMINLSEAADGATSYHDLCHAIEAVSNVQPLVQPAAPAPVAAPAAPAATNTWDVDPRQKCVHGMRVMRNGQGARGPWTGWFCPTPKGTPDQCKPEFV
jgi:hypothetical protein